MPWLEYLKSQYDVIDAFMGTPIALYVREKFFGLYIVRGAVDPERRVRWQKELAALFDECIADRGPKIDRVGQGQGFYQCMQAVKGSCIYKYDCSGTGRQATTP